MEKLLGLVSRMILWRNIFPTDVRSRKEIGFLELKQGNVTVVDYATKFEELSRFCPHYNGMEVEGSKCVKFESYLRPEIKMFITY